MTPTDSLFQRLESLGLLTEKDLRALRDSLPTGETAPTAEGDCNPARRIKAAYEVSGPATAQRRRLPTEDGELHNPG